MSQPLPEKHTGTMCNVPVEAGLVAYPCTLVQNHFQDNDEEPHFATEVARSVRAWQAWKAQHAGKEPHEHDWRIEEDAQEATCNVSGCDATLPVASAAGGFTPVDPDEVTRIIEPGPRERRKDATKQRKGDQPLPTGGQECVQDLVIAAMEESKQVGTERYGTPLMTFNGRKGIQDVAEEARDFFVYVTQVAREAEANRKQLIEVVTKALDDKGIHGDLDRSGAEIMATIAVDAVMGWVVGQTTGSASVQ